MLKLGISVKVIGIAALVLPVFSIADCQQDIPETTPAIQMVDNGDNTVTDLKTGLMWQICPSGKNPLDGSCTGAATLYNWQGALEAPVTLNLNGGSAGYTDWRLPNIKELLSIVELSCHRPAINSLVFPNNDNEMYWSSSPDISPISSVYSWVVDFDAGDARISGRTLDRQVRLVRDVESE